MPFLHRLKADTGAFSVGYAQVHPGGVPALSGTGARAGDLKGINVKYRYEFTDHLGGIVALSYASVKKSDTMKTGENTFHYEACAVVMSV
ncbi:putative outer membrane Lom [Escherichia coli]|uniref:Putative outer membrane Lom n=1 Tax=Escherichia coli TaxID=562 RepID=A0A376UCR8_ECOLX|nr:putative outer membrane Lom [Escherichia coli]